MTDHSEVCGNCGLKALRYQSASRFPRDDGLCYIRTWSVEKWICAACGRRELHTAELMTMYERGDESSGGIEVVQKGKKPELTEGKTMPSQCPHRKWGACKLNGLQSCDSAWCPKIRFPTLRPNREYDGGCTPYGEDPVADQQEMSGYEYRSGEPEAEE